MLAPISPNKDLLDLLIQAVIILVPIVIAWLLARYVRNSALPNRLSALTRLADAAVDYVENLDRRGKLALPAGVPQNDARLDRAAAWLKDEARRQGVRLSLDQAKPWVASRYQAHMANLRPLPAIADLARTAVDLVQGMEQEPLADLPVDSPRLDALLELAADYVAAQLAYQRGAVLSPQEALTWVRAEILQRQQVRRLPSGDTMLDLAHQAVSFMEGLKKSGQLAPRPGVVMADVERDVAVAWMLTEAAKLGLVLSPNEIVQAVVAVLRQK